MSESALDRFRTFAEEIGEQQGKRRGWRTWLAEQLGISYEHLWRALSGRSGISANVLEAAAARFDFDVTYFYAREGRIADFPRFRPVDFLDARRGSERDFSAAYRHALGYLEDLPTDSAALADASWVLALAVLQSPMVQTAWSIVNATSDAERTELGAQLAVQVRELFQRTAPRAIGLRPDFSGDDSE